MRKGTALLIVGIIVLIIGLGLSSMGFIMMGASPEEYEDWVTDSSREQGDEITVTGEISNREGGNFFGLEWYSYEFKGADTPFLSSEDIADEGDYITVTIKIDDFGIPEALSTVDINICLIPGIICLIIGILLIIIGIISRRKEPKQQMQPYPPGYAQHAQYPQQPPQQPYPQPYPTPPTQPPYQQQYQQTSQPSYQQPTTQQQQPYQQQAYQQQPPYYQQTKTNQPPRYPY